MLARWGHPLSRSSALMSSPVPSVNPAGNPPPLNALREPDGSGLALWSALFVASSALLVFLATEPAHAWPNMQPASAFAAGDEDAAVLPALQKSDSSLPVRPSPDRDAWQ